MRYHAQGTIWVDVCEKGQILSVEPTEGEFHPTATDQFLRGFRNKELCQLERIYKFFSPHKHPWLFEDKLDVEGGLGRPRVGRQIVSAWSGLQY